jgi:hypothetical protein
MLHHTPFIQQNSYFFLHHFYVISSLYNVIISPATFRETQKYPFVALFLEVSDKGNTPYKWLLLLDPLVGVGKWWYGAKNYLSLDLKFFRFGGCPEVFLTQPCLIHIKNMIWWKVIILSNFLEFGSECTNWLNVGISSLSTNFYAMNLRALLKPCKPSLLVVNVSFPPFFFFG